MNTGGKKTPNQKRKLLEGRTCQKELLFSFATTLSHKPYAESRNTDNHKILQRLPSRSTPCQERGFASHRKTGESTTANSISTAQKQPWPAYIAGSRD